MVGGTPHIQIETFYRKFSSSCLKCAQAKALRFWKMWRVCAQIWSSVGKDGPHRSNDIKWALWPYAPMTLTQGMIRNYTQCWQSDMILVYLIIVKATKWLENGQTWVACRRLFQRRGSPLITFLLLYFVLFSSYCKGFMHHSQEATSEQIFSPRLALDTVWMADKFYLDVYQHTINPPLCFCLGSRRESRNQKRNLKKLGAEKQKKANFPVTVGFACRGS